MLLLVAVACLALCNGALGGPCRGLARYKITLVTSWTATRFPRQYPRWRPPAHWSMLVGMSHTEAARLWQLGSPASDALAQLANDNRFGPSVLLSSLVQGKRGILDSFHAPGISKGSGYTATTFFADALHTKVSAVARLVPSPDWLVGVDSVDLCPDGQWRDSFQLEADVVDAGTDLGLTFTAPRWKAEPRENMTRITSRHPAHPASSFYYPQLNKLPRIAAFRFRRQQSYSLKQSSPQETAHLKQSASVQFPVKSAKDARIGRKDKDPPTSNMLPRRQADRSEIAHHTTTTWSRAAGADPMPGFLQRQ
ncbi:spondin-2-like [Ornithodoros turicata]|uniref:spondin-2-like n=1 Tax=Ornithodoros turicata TaxID=34597 RepID=UPI00313967B3